MNGSLDDALDDVCQRLRAAVTRQHDDRDPAHEDFYAWGWALTELLDRADQALTVLERQIPRYGDRRVLRDDEGAEPAARLAEISARLASSRAALNPARDRIREYHSAVSHVAVEVNPDAEVEA